MPRYSNCPNCGANSTSKSGSPINIFSCKSCYQRFCGFCADGKSGNSRSNVQLPGLRVPPKPEKAGADQRSDLGNL